MEHRDISDELAADEQRRSIEQRLARIERRLGHIAGSVDVGTYRFFRRRLRPRLWSYEQYSSRHLRIRPEYRLEKPPAPPPRIAIVTPSWNQGMLIRWSVDSVLQHNYPNRAYLVQDGGSTDETTKVVASYGNTLSWRS